MRFETWQMIRANRHRFMYDAADGTGTDQSTDPGAETAINPNHFLAPVIGGSGLIKLLVIVALVMAIIYLTKLNFGANG